MLEYNVWLQLILGAGNNRAKKIISHYGNAENVFKAKAEERKNSKLFTTAEINRMNHTPLQDALIILAECKENNIDIIPLGDDRYPYCLSVIDNPPLVLYVKGNFPDFDNYPAICIVGPRIVSDFGKRAAYSLGYRLSKSGMIVVSGGALGTDTYAHAGALKASGQTVLVMGCGILNNYLPENKALRDKVSINGCLISEHPPKTPILKGAFPIRNRILSALSLGTVVVEAGNRSGGLITARYAAEQGRDVFVIPGSPDKKEYKGSNELLRDGAKPLLDASDIFNEYIVRFPSKINIETAYDGPIITAKKEDNIEKNEKIQKKLNESLSNEAKIVYNRLNKQKFFPEDISDTGLSASELLSALTELEMEFYIKALPGGMYEKM